VDPQLVLTGAQDAMTARRVFGDPISVEGVTVLPVATIGGGGGGGAKGAGNDNVGVGFGLGARAAGVFVIRDGDAKWRPALNLNRVILGGQLVGMIAVLTAGLIVRRWLANGHT